MGSDFSRETMQIRLGKLVETVGPDSGKQLVETFLGVAPLVLGKMRHALGSRNVEALAWETHAFKGMCAVFGLQNLIDHCSEIETLVAQEHLDGVAELLPTIQELLEDFVRYIEAEGYTDGLSGVGQ